MNTDVEEAPVLQDHNGELTRGAKEPGLPPALDSMGVLRYSGWARGALFDYNQPFMGGPNRMRITSSDRYIIFSATHMIVFEVLDSGFLGRIGISIISFKDRRRSTQVVDNLFSLGRYEMPGTSTSGSVRIREKNAALDFIIMKEGVRIIKVDFKHFGHHRHLRGEVVLSPYTPAPGPGIKKAQSGPESLVTLSAWRNEKKSHRYFCCSPWYITEGVMQFGTAEIFFTQDNAWGIFDWIREARPRRDIHYWACACGIADGKLTGFSLGYGSVDASAGSENAFFVNGRIHKLDQVMFHIPPAEWLEEWSFSSNDGRLQMHFSPSQERHEHRRILIYSIRRRQVFGTFSGRVILDDGSELAFWNISGFAERRKTKN
jgi:hypothetical protein